MKFNFKSIPQISIIFILTLVLESCENNWDSSLEEQQEVVFDSSKFMYVTSERSLFTWIYKDSSSLIDGMMKIDSGFFTKQNDSVFIGNFLLNTDNLILMTSPIDSVLNRKFENFQSSLLNKKLIFEITDIIEMDSLQEFDVDSTFYTSNPNNQIVAKIIWNNKILSKNYLTNLTLTDSTFISESKLIIYPAFFGFNEIRTPLRLGYRLEGKTRK